MLSKPNHNNWHWPIYNVWQGYLNASLLTSLLLHYISLESAHSTVHTYNTTVD